MKTLAHYLFQFTDDAEGVKLSMGLENFSIFMNVLASLVPAAYHLNYLCGNPSINVSDQIFLALMKCRMYKTNGELMLSGMFKISDTEVYSIFITRISGRSWTFGQSAKQQWKELHIWQEGETVRSFLHSSSPSTRVWWA